MKALARLLLLFAGLALTVIQPATAAPTPIDYLPALKGGYFPIKSKETDLTYHIYVRLPDGYDANPQRKYPVVYLLDGDSLFPLLAPTHLFLTYDDKLPEAIVVGIAYGSFDPAINKRDIDFSATSNNKDRPARAPQFLKFLATELLPSIEERYRADPAQRILLGQSRAAYFVLYSAFAEPTLFRGRIASNTGMRDGEEKFLQAGKSDGKGDRTLILSSGTKDRESNRQTAQRLNLMFKERDATLPWTFIPLDIEDGSHAADIGRVYRSAMKVLLGSEAKKPD